jgi:hypothetical protein
VIRTPWIPTFQSGQPSRAPTPTRPYAHLKSPRNSAAKSPPLPPSQCKPTSIHLPIRDLYYRTSPHPLGRSLPLPLLHLTQRIHRIPARTGEGPQRHRQSPTTLPIEPVITRWAILLNQGQLHRPPRLLFETFNPSTLLRLRPPFLRHTRLPSFDPATGDLQIT